jgi:hypothetical protein
MSRTIRLSAIGAIAGVLAGATGVMAQAVNDPSVGGQLNQCWGQVASQLAKVGTPDGTSGGGMGQHSRSTQAADTNGGFANSDNAFGITFNVDGGRTGVGNVSKGAPHNANPGDGGNGQHAINNSSDTTNGLGLATILNPVNGQLTTAVGGTAEVVTLQCDLVP